MVKPFPTTSKIPAKSVKILSSSALSNFPAPLPGCGSSVRTERFSGPRVDHVESPLAAAAGDGGMAVMVGAGELTPNDASVVVAERAREGENGRGDNSTGNI